MGIGSIALKFATKGLKYGKVVPRYAFGEGYGVISSARKAAGQAAGKGYTVFSGAGIKTKAGWSALKQDLVATANKPGIFAKAKSAWNIGIGKANLKSATSLTKLQKLAAGSKGIFSAAKNSIKTTWKAGAQAASAGKYLGKLGKFGKVIGGTKSLLKPLCKMPVLASIITLAFEAPEIYKAFTNKDGGIWEGTKQLFKSGTKIAAGAAVGALGTVVGGPIGGVIGYAAGEMLANYLLGGDYSENHPTEAEPDEQEQAKANGVMEEPDTQAARDRLRAENEAADQAAQDSESGESATETDSQSTASADNQQQTSTLPDRLEPSDTSVQPQQTLTSNPYTMGYTPYSNPFGFDAGSNIFQRFPMGYTFQYQGNGMGMMV